MTIYKYKVQTTNINIVLCNLYFVLYISFWYTIHHLSGISLAQAVW